MISLDQVLLLQEKVESAVEKITSLTERISQLESDNDALNRKCLELTKALEEKTELVSTLELAQTKIEESILVTINRLDSVEDAILNDNAAESGKNAAEPVSGENDSAVSPTPSSENSKSEVTVPENSPDSIKETAGNKDNKPDSINPIEKAADEPFVYEQKQEASGLLHKTAETAENQNKPKAFTSIQPIEQPQIFASPEPEEPEVSAESEQNSENKASSESSALDGQFDIF